MVIEVFGTGFHNKGAELMLLAIIDQVARWAPGARVAATRRTGAPSDLRRHGASWLADPFHPELMNRKALGASLAGLLPISVRRNMDVVRRSETSGLLDASGFGYSDKWGVDRALVGLRVARRAKKFGVPVVLLPQAFGPFADPGVRDAVSELIRVADLVFPRDEVSARHLESLGAPYDGHVAPDFTGLLHAPPHKGDLPGDVCVVPNVRMTDKADGHAAAAYVRYMARCIQVLVAHGRRPFLLAHTQTEDLALALRIEAKTGERVPVLVADDALSARSIIAATDGVVASRYHALINAMNHAIPAIGTSWSHKYEQLFAERGCSECLVRELDLDSVELHLRPLLDRDTGNLVAARLQASRGAVNEKATAMWRTVRRQIMGEGA